MLGGLYPGYCDDCVRGSSFAYPADRDLFRAAPVAGRPAEGDLLIGYFFTEPGFAPGFAAMPGLAPGFADEAGFAPGFFVSI